MSKDPMRSVNPYVYVGNNPINYTDPYGLQKEGEFPCVTPVPPKTPTPRVPQKFAPAEENPCDQFVMGGRKSPRLCDLCCDFIFRRSGLFAIQEALSLAGGYGIPLPTGPITLGTGLDACYNYCDSLKD